MVQEEHRSSAAWDLVRALFADEGIVKAASRGLAAVTRVMQTGPMAGDARGRP